MWDLIASVPDHCLSFYFTIDRQTVIYNSTIHALELILFDSNTQETIKKQLYPSDSFRHCTEETRE